jgi:chorismate dehydratase
MLGESDCALLIGDPALVIPDSKFQIPDWSEPPAVAGGLNLRKFDLAELWKDFTGFGFIFAMWMTRRETCEIDFASTRDEGLRHLDEIISNYESEIPLNREEFYSYLTENISFTIDDSMQEGLELYFELAHKNGLIENLKTLQFI